MIWMGCSLREMTESCSSHVKKTRVVDGVGGLRAGLAWEEKQQLAMHKEGPGRGRSMRAGAMHRPWKLE